MEIHNTFLIIFKTFLLNLLIFESVKAETGPIVCSGSGRLPLNDISCQYYYKCFEGLPTIFKCPDDTVFDPIKKTCVLPTQYPCDMLPQTTTNPYKCLTSGRFPIDDPTCQKYYLCYWSAKGYLKKILKCPNQTIFDPIRKLCVLRTTYTCSESTTELY
ncbi:hypothetical protein HZH68_005238 [Vespula germanica]|uniref:Chitin-binding type-2 domain-containing protein n=1 Tax=Vespula germanica TaxID=30212 RepID=A0A834KJC0_VESGE|nr:hypothetical protein HZH68_005238 [Vespula germanica]